MFTDIYVLGTVLGSEIMVGNEMGTAPGLKGAHILEK